MNNTELFASITEKIIANLETSGSWQKLWQVPSPISIGGRYYRGINVLILATDKYLSRVYGTFNQIRANGGTVRKGEKATTVVFWKKSIKEDENTGKTRLMFYLHYYHVFNSEQANFDEEGIKKIAALQNLVTEKNNADIMETEAIISGYPNPPKIRFNNSDDRACYYAINDMISMPEKKFFINSAAYYRVMFHEMGHSTGHPCRLDREHSSGNKHGDTEYSKEELVAELCSSYLTGISGLEIDIRNSAFYIRGWASALRDNTKWIMWAASRAEAASNYILGRESSSEGLEVTTDETITALETT